MAQADSRQMPEWYRNRREAELAPGWARVLETMADGRTGARADSGYRCGDETQMAVRGGPRWRPGKANEAEVPGGVAEQLPSLIHDARNMVLVLDLYCALLEEPGVLAPPYRHFAVELRRVGAANRRLLEGLARLGPSAETHPVSPGAGQAPCAPAPVGRSGRQPDWLAFPGATESQNAPLDALGKGMGGDGQVGVVASGSGPGDSRRACVAERTVENLAGELRANRNLLAAMAGHAITVGMSIRGGGCAVAISGDDLTRVLVNLVRNAAEAMPRGGHIQIGLEEGPEFLALSVSDNGPGIPEDALETIFSPGYSTHVGLRPQEDADAWPAQHRGLGLSIVRSLVVAAGGAVWAANRNGGPPRSREGEMPWSGGRPEGAVFVVEFPRQAAGGMTRKPAVRG